MRLALGLGMLLVTASSVLAQDVTHVYANGWQADNFHDPANPGCSIGGDGSVPGSRLIMGASLHRPNPMDLVIRRTAWAIPAGTPIHLRAVFSNGSTVPISGTGLGQEINIELDNNILPIWVHLLTSSTSMQLIFEGNEASHPWSFDLTGTSAVINAMGDCFRQQSISGVAAPFSQDVSLQNALVSSPSPPTYVSKPAAAPAAYVAGSSSTPRGPALANQNWAEPTPASQPAAPMQAPEMAATAAPQDCRSIASAVGRLDCYDHGPAASSAITPAPVAPTPVEPALAPTPVRISPVPPPSSGPNDSQSVVETIVTRAATAFKAAANDMQAGGLRSTRARDLCQALPSGRAVNWTGKVEALSSNTSGKGVLTISIGNDITIGTMNNSLSDDLSGGHTLIEPDSALFQQVAGLSVGTPVRFTATLLRGATDCFEETSLTQRGSMTEPDFVAHFERVTPQ